MNENNSTENIGIFCPKCGGTLNSVYQTEKRAEVIFRRRKCLCCGKSFSTYECAENSSVLCLQIIPDTSNHDLLGNMITEKEVFKEYCQYMDTKDAGRCTESFRNIITSDAMREYRIPVSEINEERFITNPDIIKNVFEIVLYLYDWKLFLKYSTEKTSASSFDELMDEVKDKLCEKDFTNIQEKALFAGYLKRDTVDSDKNMLSDILD